MSSVSRVHFVTDVHHQIMSILQDPIMQSILQQAKGDPAALNDHMKNPQIRQKVQKLVAAGVIKVGGR